MKNNNSMNINIMNASKMNAQKTGGKRIGRGTRNILIVAVLIVLMIVGIVMWATSCRQKVNEMEVVETLLESGSEDVILIDYLRRVVGTEKEQGYYEVVLYAIPTEEGLYSKEEVRMDVYTDGGLRTEKLVSSNVPYSVFERAMGVIKEQKMSEWSELEEPTAIDGCTYVCKFPAGAQYIKVTSNEMPENGLEAFGAVLEALTAPPDPVDE